MKYLQSPPGKRIDGLAADMPASEAATRVLRIRLRAVEEMLPLARKRAGESPEFVHQLRVSTRRADAALRTLGACLRKSVSEKVRRRLRRIRRSATAARECDVHLEHFHQQRDAASGDDRAVFDDLVAWTERQREDAQHAIEDAAVRDPVAKLRKARKKVLAAVREPRHIEASDGDTVTLLDMSRATVPPLIDAMREAAAADLHVLDNLHELRIRGKRVRYALEIFGDCYEGRLVTEYERVTTLQQELGTINDLDEIIHRVERFAAALADDADADRRAAIDAVLDGYRERLAAARRHAVEDCERGAWTVALDTLAAAIDGKASPHTREIAS